MFSFERLRSNRRVSVWNVIRLFYELEHNLVNRLPTYLIVNDNERNSLSWSPSPIFFPRYRHSFSPSFAPIRYFKKNELLSDEDEVLVMGREIFFLVPTFFPIVWGLIIREKDVIHMI
jgi:hypothetical protein